MKVLALDAATEACGVALLADQETIVRSREAGPGQAGLILQMIDGVLAEGGTRLQDLDGIVASVGPGSFTGVRVSVSVAQGLAFGAGLPVIGVTTLEALAFEVLAHEVLALEARADVAGTARALACLDARMGEVYWGSFAADARRGVIALGRSRVSPPSEVRWPGSATYRGIGRGFRAHPALAALAGLELEARDADALPGVLHMARLGALRLAAGEGMDPAELQPSYLRDKVAYTELERAAGKMNAAE